MDSIYCNLVAILSSEQLGRVCVCVNLVKDIFVHMSSIFLKMMSYDKISGLLFQKSMKYLYFCHHIDNGFGG